jgi:hypothetical protein
MSIQRVYLVISADGRVRAAKRPQIRTDEVAIAINLQFPDTWGRVVQTLDVTVPDFTPRAEPDES